MKYLRVHVNSFLSFNHGVLSVSLSVLEQQSPVSPILTFSIFLISGGTRRGRERHDEVFEMIQVV